MRNTRTGQWIRRWSGGFLASTLLLGTGVRGADISLTHVHVLITGPTGIIVRSAVEGSMRRLEQPGCAALFGDFEASDGLPLAVHLFGLSLTPSQYVRTIWFADAGDLSRCHNADGPVAFTAPGHSVVYVCGEHFVSLYGRNRAYAEIVVIHEVLHTAGLGENPPTSQYISSVALARCRSAG
jgi:hypothetical protein